MRRGTASLVAILLLAFGVIPPQIAHAETPVVSSLQPASALPGASITILGSGFQSGASVRFGLQPSAQVTYLGPTALVAVVPPGGSGFVVLNVINADGTPSAAALFNYPDLNALTVSSITPNVAASAGGTAV